MFVRRRNVVSIAAAIFGLLLAAGQPVFSQTHLVSSTVFSGGGRIDYSPKLNLLTIDKAATAQGLFNTYTIKANGTNSTCLTCGKPVVSLGHNGNPAWHPSGQYILFQVQDTTLQILPSQWQNRAYLVTNPGYGTNNNLWLMTADGAQMWQLTHYTAGQGVLHAHFNPSGNLVLWAFKYDYTGPDQQWVMNLANLTWTNGVPALTNIQTISPLGNVNMFYETHGFSPDGNKIIFSAGSPSKQTLNIFTYDLTTRTTVNLTNTGAGMWNEHAHFAPDNSRIIFASSMNITLPRPGGYYVPFLDYWSMNVDGTNRVRLTYFNDPSAPEFYQYGLLTADFDYSSIPTTIYGGLQQTQADNTMFYALSIMKFQY